LAPIGGQILKILAGGVEAIAVNGAARVVIGGHHIAQARRAALFARRIAGGLTADPIDAKSGLTGGVIRAHCSH